jgi:hypothetical protein
MAKVESCTEIEVATSGMAFSCSGKNEMCTNADNLPHNTSPPPDVHDLKLVDYRGVIRQRQWQNSQSKKIRSKAAPRNAASTMLLATDRPYEQKGKKAKRKPDVGLEPTTLRLRVSRATDCASRACCCFVRGWQVRGFITSAIDSLKVARRLVVTSLVI